jgi:hypothetical protein
MPRRFGAEAGHEPHRPPHCAIPWPICCRSTSERVWPMTRILGARPGAARIWARCWPGVRTGRYSAAIGLRADPPAILASLQETLDAGFAVLLLSDDRATRDPCQGGPDRPVGFGAGAAVMRAGRPPKNGHTAVPFRTLASYGISKKQSSRWQKLAEIPTDDFEQILQAAGGRLSTAGILREWHGAKARRVASTERMANELRAAGWTVLPPSEGLQ